MSNPTLDMAAVMAAANDALAQPSDAPAAQLPPGHECQTGCGRLANVVMVRIADSDLDIMCDVCALMMYLAIADAMPGPAGIDGQAPDADTEAGTAPPAPES